MDMAKQGQTGIVWTDETWNPVTGCTKVSQGCKHCYAERDWHRLQHLPRFAGRAFTDVVCHPERLDQPLRWAKPRLIFVNSMSDLFHEDVPDEFIDQVFAVMALAKQHTFQVLTKRPERMREYARGNWQPRMMGHMRKFGRIPDGRGVMLQTINGNLPNVWLGVSVEDQATADQRIPILLQTPAAVRWISAEPLLGPIDLNRLQFLGGEVGDKMSALSGRYLAAYGTKSGAPKLDWVVVGGESGPKARPMHPDWVRILRDQCAAAVVQFMLKQWGEWAPNCLCSRPDACKTTQRPEPGKPGCMFRCGKKAAGRLLDGVQHDGYPA
jgi:protein gp37